MTTSLFSPLSFCTLMTAMESRSPCVSLASCIASWTSSKAVPLMDKTLSPASRVPDSAAGPCGLTRFTSSPPRPSLFLKVTPRPKSFATPGAGAVRAERISIEGSRGRLLSEGSSLTP
eukprot:CAMPEP_0180371678 /NCGR_PEP_ID=MMETSP0989-20121125/19979_1 /TAXON_ID=697907 /ORGANISM="non described non described, Strain CCMP2293" /LENGTH=117 /DNA_ID=CAMNT_0022367781 /DNA_START=299 /DNA_END=649 /DNA_ORIENTATION=-